MNNFTIKEMPMPRADVCRAILQGLPEWFGIPSALENYATDTEKHPTFGAYDLAGGLLGFVTLHPHNEFTVEIHVIAVARSHHSRGIGRLLVNFAKSYSQQKGYEFLEVKTLGASSPDPFYQQTRNFYQSMGFRAIEELHGVWADNPCLIMVMPL